MTITIKRAYQPANEIDGDRVLVDRLWPRGVSKDDARFESWAKDIAPSNELRKWFGHDPEKWSHFRERYFKELDDNPSCIQELVNRIRGHNVTLVYSTRSQLNNAKALKEYLETRYPDLR